MEFWKNVELVVLVRVQPSGRRLGMNCRPRLGSIPTRSSLGLLNTRFWRVGSCYSCIHGLPPRGGSKGPCLGVVHVIKKRMLSWCCSQLVSTFDWFAVGILMLKKNLVEFDTLSAVIIALQWIVFFVLVIVWLEFSILKQVTVLGNKGKETSFKVGLLIDIFYSKSK